MDLLSERSPRLAGPVSSVAGPGEHSASGNDDVIHCVINNCT